MDFNKSKIPNKITPCPIAEAVVELRYEPSVPAEAIVGILFNAFKSDFPTLEKLPILELPSVIRDSDPNLKYAAHYRMRSKNFQLLIGPRSFAVINPKEYAGWTTYFSIIEKTFAILQGLQVISKPTRIGLRYISFFEKLDIFNNLKMGFELAGNSMIGSNNVVRSEFNYESFKCVVQLANNSVLNNTIPGSTIDIDIIKENDAAILTNLKANIELAHNVEKQIFFSLLKEEYLAKFSQE